MLFTTTHNIMMFHSIIKIHYYFICIDNIIFILSEAPIIKTINITDYEFKQSKYEHVPKLPLEARFFNRWQNSSNSKFDIKCI